MRCLVVGGGGFIGSRVSNLLVETGREVIVLGRRPVSPKRLSKKAKYVSGDYKNRALIRTLLKGTHELIDLAYATVPKTSFDDPVNDILCNLPAGVGLVQEASAAKLKKFVFVSSGGTVYGIAKTLPIHESHATNPVSPYGITKLTLEKYILMFAALKQLPATIVRPGNAYGEHQEPFTGQGFVAAAIKSILLKRAVDIFGPTGTVRDYLHVEDIARGIIAALNFGESGEIYNIGCGVGRSNLDVLESIKTFAEPAGYSIDINTLPQREFDVPVNILDSSKLGSISSWRPEIDFHEGIRRTWLMFSSEDKIDK